MDREFWLGRWREGRTPFNEGVVNRFLQQFTDRLAGCPRILVPLCGKTEDLAYLARDHEVVGIELAESAIQQFFAEHDIEPISIMTLSDTLKVYRRAQLTLIAGDFFATTAEMVGSIDAVYDRAAIVALPAPDRVRYAQHVRRLAPYLRKQLLVSVEYPPGSYDGPPFSVPASEIQTLYPDAKLELLAESPDPRDRADGKMMEYCYELTF